MKISADYIFPGNGTPIKNGVIEINNNGVIIDIMNPAEDNINWDGITKYEGIICPGFVNTHCHLELSYLKGKISEKTQLTGFIKELVSIREDFNEKERLHAITLAEEEMIENGIVAVGDISNGDSTFNQKALSNINYHTFIEVFGTNTNVADNAMQHAQNLKYIYPNSNVSIVPHAPYSMSPTLVKKVVETKEGIITIHNQETEDENLMFEKAEGEILKVMQNFAPEMLEFNATGKSSLQSYLPNYFGVKKMLLVHNTFTQKGDIEFARNSPIDTYWCFCPNANEYIEGTQPNYNLFLDEKCTIGTDSYASNWSLSILDELKTIVRKDKSISLEKLIEWATYNGARFLGFSHLGSIEKGKAPGLNLIQNIDLENLRLTDRSVVNPLIKPQPLINR